MVRRFGTAIVALRRAAGRNQASIIRIDGRALVILPLRDYRRLERLLEREEKEARKEEELDRLDVEEAKRILSDPAQVPIPYEQVRRELGLGDVSP